MYNDEKYQPNESHLMGSEMERALKMFCHAIDSELAEVVIRIGQSGHATITQTKKIRLHVERD